LIPPQQKVVELGGLGCLVPLLDNHDEMIVKLAAMTIANLGSEEEHRKVLRDLSVVEPLVRLLDSRDDEVCEIPPWP
jgi:Armadillo/beta-catenin-like repeat